MLHGRAEESRPPVRDARPACRARAARRCCRRGGSAPADAAACRGSAPGRPSLGRGSSPCPGARRSTDPADLVRDRAVVGLEAAAAGRRRLHPQRLEGPDARRDARRRRPSLAISSSTVVARRRSGRPPGSSHRRRPACRERSRRPGSAAPARPRGSAARPRAARPRVNGPATVSTAHCSLTSAELDPLEEAHHRQVLQRVLGQARARRRARPCRRVRSAASAARRARGVRAPAIGSTARRRDR